MGAPATEAEGFGAMTLAEVAERFSWTAEQVATERGRCEAVAPYEPTPGDMDRLAGLARESGDHMTAARLARRARAVRAAEQSAAL